MCLYSSFSGYRELVTVNGRVIATQRERTDRVTQTDTRDREDEQMGEKRTKSGWVGVGRVRITERETHRENRERERNGQTQRADRDGKTKNRADPLDRQSHRTERGRETDRPRE